MSIRSRALVLVVLLSSIFVASSVHSSAQSKQPPAQPIRLHPKNPHYFLFRGKAIALVTSGEHYGAVLNADVDYKKYLATIDSDGLNYTRIFGGLRTSKFPQSPSASCATIFCAAAESFHRPVGAQ